MKHIKDYIIAQHLYLIENFVTIIIAIKSSYFLYIIILY
jgi:hypothetical protein